MVSNIPLNQLLNHRLPGSDGRHLVLLTGARRVGKTTSVRSFYNNVPYFNLDAPEYRIQLQETTSFSWGKTMGNATLDEVQDPRNSRKSYILL